MRTQLKVDRFAGSNPACWSVDTFYLNIATADPFLSVEQYGRAMRVANNAHPKITDFPVLCGWSVGTMSKLPEINNSVKLVGELEAVQKCGLTKYTKVGMRLEPDVYCYRDGNTGQVWWDDEHWAKGGHLSPLRYLCQMVYRHQPAQRHSLHLFPVGKALGWSVIFK